MNNYKTFVDDYLLNHINGEIYNQLNNSAKFSTVSLAYEDITSYLGVKNLDINDTTIMAALCEQILWILEKNQAKQAQITSESIDGIGSKTYKVPSKSYNNFIAGRAVSLLECKILRYTTSISRG